MTEIVSMVEVKRKYWFNIVKTCKQSGTPVVTWCKENHIAESTYWYWHKQYSNMVAQVSWAGILTLNYRRNRKALMLIISQL